MKKVQVGFRFSPEADSRLKELAAEGGTTRTAILERLIMGEVLPTVESERRRYEEMAKESLRQPELQRTDGPVAKARGEIAPNKPSSELTGDGTDGPRTKPDLDRIAKFQRGMGRKK